MTSPTQRATRHGVGALNGSESCPTGEELKRERFLNPAAYTDDVWGTPFRIECDRGEAVVVSAGPDLAFDTEDDFEASD